jgi:hypothetical protein
VVTLEKAPQRGPFEERDVAVEQKHGARTPAKCRLSLKQGVSRAKLRRLQHELQTGTPDERASHEVGFVANDEDHVAGGQVVDRAEDMFDEGLSDERMQDLRVSGLHPRAFARGEYDDVEIRHELGAGGTAGVPDRPGSRLSLGAGSACVASSRTGRGGPGRGVDEIAKSLESAQGHEIWFIPSLRPHIRTGRNGAAEMCQREVGLVPTRRDRREQIPRKIARREVSGDVLRERPRTFILVVVECGRRRPQTILDRERIGLRIASRAMAEPKVDSRAIAKGLLAREATEQILEAGSRVLKPVLLKQRHGTLEHGNCLGPRLRSNSRRVMGDVDILPGSSAAIQ